MSILASKSGLIDGIYTYRTSNFGASRIVLGVAVGLELARAFVVVISEPL